MTYYLDHSDKPQPNPIMPEQESLQANIEGRLDFVVADLQDRDGFQEAMTDIMHLIEQDRERAVVEAHILEATHRANDAIERLWRLDKEACTRWYQSQAEFYVPLQAINTNKSEES